MVWAVVWGARVALASLDMQKTPCISMVWVVLWGGTVGRRIHGNARNSVHLHCLGCGVGGAGGGKVTEMRASVPKLSAQPPHNPLHNPFSQPP